LELMMETAREGESIADLRYMVRIFGLVYWQGDGGEWGSIL
jgi:hypothetical protein